MPLHVQLSGTEIPHAQDVLDLWPARILAIVGNSLGTLAVVAVALLTLRSRPLGNALDPRRDRGRGDRERARRARDGALAPAIAVAAVLLYAGFVSPRRASAASGG